MESANAWKDRLQESREQDAHSKVLLEEKISKLECDKVLVEEKLAAEAANAKLVMNSLCQVVAMVTRPPYFTGYYGLKRKVIKICGKGK